MICYIQASHIPSSIHDFDHPEVGCTHRAFAPCLLFGWPITAQAEIFTMRCSIEGSFPALEDKKVPPAEVSIEIQSIGNNLYFKVQGAKPYEMFINTLTTDQFIGKNLTNPSSMGIQQKTVANGELRELRIARANMALSGYADIPHQRKTQRMNLQGQCKPA